MQRAPVMKGSGLIPVNEEVKANEEVHVFGTNLEERVVADNEEQSPSTSFANIIADQKEDDINEIKNKKFDAITGEEDEDTIFQGDFKLFVWDLATSNWIEKGRGQLRLNDSISDGKQKSRLIMRLSGTLRIILNVAIKNSFFKVIANSKANIRFTDSQTVWAASGSNADQLRDLIDERLKLTSEKSIDSNCKRPISDDEDNSPNKKTRANSDEEDSSSAQNSPPSSLSPTIGSDKSSIEKDISTNASSSSELEQSGESKQAENGESSSVSQEVEKAPPEEKNTPEDEQKPSDEVTSEKET